MEALFELIRIALGAEGSVPEGADWPALVALATEQGVAALAHDGLQKCYEADPRLSLPLDRELKAVKYDWFGSTLNVEMEYEKQWKAVSSLSKAFAAEGLRTIVLKGFALSSCYPVPQHRYSCDFDCFLIGSGPVTDRGVYERGNQAVEAMGVKVDRSFYKNSSFVLKGTKVENHRFLTGWRGSRRWKRFEMELEQMLEVPGALRALDTVVLAAGTDSSGGGAPGDGALFVGPPLFNALFLTRHAHLHFLVEEGISLRHLCDWELFLRRYRSEFDWNEFMSICSRYGLARFAESMTRVAEYVCDGTGTLTPADRRLLDDILALGKHTSQPKTRLATALRILRSGWKFRAFSDETRLGCLLRYVWGYFIVRTPKL